MSAPDPKPTKQAKRRKPPTTPEEREERLRFKTVVLHLDGGCVAHRYPTDCEGEFHAHHVITQQQLREAGRNDLRWDWRNGATVCELAHRRHHSASQRLSIDALPARCIEFVREHGFKETLSRFYTAAT